MQIFISTKWDTWALLSDLVHLTKAAGNTWWSPKAWAVRSRTVALDTGQCFCLQRFTHSQKKLPGLAVFQWNCKQLWHKITFCNLSFVIVTINSATYASVNVCLERIHSKRSINIWFNSKSYKEAKINDYKTF